VSDFVAILHNIVLLVRPYSVCPPWTHNVCGRQSTVRRSTRICTGAGAVCSLHCRPHRAIECHSLSPHLYADDTHVHGSCSPSSISTLSAQLIQCIDAVAGWMSSNRLQLNSDKTEVLWCSTSRRQSQLPRTPLPVGGTSVDPVRRVRDLGIHIDCDLVMCSHVQKTTSARSAFRQLEPSPHSTCRAVHGRHPSVLRCRTSHLE